MNEKFRSVISHSSDDKIKVIYSWHGPRGPVWNTELPNILTFASAAEGINPNMESRNFWTDDIWQKQFSKAKDKYEMYPVQSIESDDKRPFIYPFSMTWRVQFQQYFGNNSGILEFSHMPKYLIYLVQTGNGYILIDHSVEAFMSDQELEAMFSYFHSHYRLPMYKIIYLTGTVNATYVYNDWFTRSGIADIKEHRMHVIPYASSREIFHNFVVNDHSVYNNDVVSNKCHYDETVVPEKLFLSWNRRYRQHRTILLLMLEDLDVVDRSYISCAKVSDENSSLTFENTIDRATTTDFNFDNNKIDKFVNRLPLVIDGETDINVMCEDHGFTRDFYSNSLVSIVTETNYEAKECTLTEKSFKPLYNKHPFIIIGAPGALQGLRDLGFKTFSEFWDESYDDESNGRRRFIKIRHQLQKIASWDTVQILHFKHQVKPILEHNYNIFKESGAIPVINNIYKHITANFEPGWTNWCDPSNGYCINPNLSHGENVHEQP